MIARALGWTTVVGTTVFSLWALYISLVEHPARLAAGPTARRQFQESYRRAAPWQAGAAAVALLSGVGAAVTTRDWSWAVAGVVVGCAIPYTLAVIMPTNRRLLGGESLRDDEAMELMRRWGRHHWVRTLLGLVALAMLCARLRLE